MYASFSTSSLGIQKLCSWGEDAWVVFGAIMLVVFPRLMILLTAVVSFQRPPNGRYFGHKVDFRPDTRRHEAAQSEQGSIELRIRPCWLVAVQDFGFEPLNSAVVATRELR